MISTPPCSPLSTPACFLNTDTLTPNLKTPSLPSEPDPAILDALCKARNSADVRAIQQQFDANDVHAAWPSVPLVQRSALLLARAFNGDIFHDLTTADFGESDPL